MIPGQVYYQLRLLWYETRAILRHKATPGQLVFGRDTIINSPFIADWGDIIFFLHSLISPQPAMNGLFIIMSRPNTSWPGMALWRSMARVSYRKSRS